MFDCQNVVSHDKMKKQYVDKTLGSKIRRNFACIREQKFGKGKEIALDKV